MAACIIIFSSTENKTKKIKLWFSTLKINTRQLPQSCQHKGNSLNLSPHIYTHQDQAIQIQETIQIFHL